MLVQSRSRNAFHEAVAVADVEHQHAMAAVLEVVANAGFGHIKKFSFRPFILFHGCETLRQRHDQRRRTPQRHRHQPRAAGISFHSQSGN